MPMLRRKTGKADDGPVYLTPQGIRRMRERLARLKAALPERIAEAQRTADFGDRSDNAAYKDAKGLLRRTHRQIWSIEDQLKRVVPIVPPATSATVQIGSTVVIESKDGTRKTFEILGPIETDPGAGRISLESPLGKALLNQPKGSTVIIKTPQGLREYRIVEIMI